MYRVMSVGENKMVPGRNITKLRKKDYEKKKKEEGKKDSSASSDDHYR